jgi:hypothetical protein
MPYCHRCGVVLPDVEGAEFCPNCGTLVTVKTLDKGQSSGLRPTKQGISRSSRMKGSVIAAVACLIVISIGALLPVDPYEAQYLLQEFEGIEEALSSFGVILIFGNNLMHSLIMFAPLIGPVYGSYVLYSTGRVVAAVASVNGANPLFLLVVTLAFPHAWLEFISYGIALSESFWLTLMIARHGLKTELSSALKSMAICSLALLAAAFVEVLLISLFG